MIRVVLIGLDLVVALSAICGGVALATGLESKRFAPSLLDGTPFHSYRPPGLILAIAVGGSAAVALALMFLLPAIAPCLRRGRLVMTGWIVGEVVILSNPQARSCTQALYFVVGVAMVALGLIGGAAIGQFG